MVKRVILSLDYDGCSSVLTPEGLYSEAARTNNKFFLMKLTRVVLMSEECNSESQWINIIYI